MTKSAGSPQDDATPLFYQEMVESAHDGLLLVEGGIIIGCNPAACRLYGLSHDELVGSHPGQLSPQFQADGESSAVKANRYMNLAIAGEPQRFLWQHIRRGHGEFTAEVTLNPARPVINADGLTVPRFVTILRDVTAEEATAAALRNSEMRFRQLFEYAPVPLALIRDEEVLGINKSWQDLFGYPAEDIRTLGDWWERAYPDKSYQHQGREAWAASLKLLLDMHGVVPSHEYRVRCGDGTDRHVLIGAARVGDEVMVGFSDMTAQHQAQQALARLNSELESRVHERTAELQQAIEHLQRTQQDLVRSEKLAGLGSLVAGVAHELNTPIGNAMMMASSMEQMEKDLSKAVQAGLKRSVFEAFLAELKESTDIVQRNLRRAAELISSFKQVAVDQSSYQRRTFDLAEVVHELRVTLSPTLRKAQVALSEDVAGKLAMNSYPGPLTQVLMNIVNNSVMHAFDGRTDRQVSIVSEDADDDHIRLVVSDNGCGIPAEHQPRLFDPFFTTRLGQGGSGLGLHIVYNLVTGLLGGRIDIYSKPGEGTRTILVLPRQSPRQASDSHTRDS